MNKKTDHVSAKQSMDLVRGHIDDIERRWTADCGIRQIEQSLGAWQGQLRSGCELLHLMGEPTYLYRYDVAKQKAKLLRDEKKKAEKQARNQLELPPLPPPLSKGGASASTRAIVQNREWVYRREWMASKSLLMAQLSLEDLISALNAQCSAEAARHCGYIHTAVRELTAILGRLRSDLEAEYESAKASQ